MVIERIKCVNNEPATWNISPDFRSSLEEVHLDIGIVETTVDNPVEK